MSFRGENQLPPPTANPDSSVWVDEAIWGHRLYDEQTPWFVYLEFLNVACSAYKEANLFEEPAGFSTLRYHIRHRLHLRNILFNFPLTKLQELATTSEPDSEKWARWFKEMDATAVGLLVPDFEYLRIHFDNFNDFVEVVRVLHTSCLEVHSNKRWSSKFVFPFSPEALFEDLDRKAVTSDRRFFGRTGELVYLMICRAKARHELSGLLERRFFKGKATVWTHIVKALQPREQNDGAERSAGFLALKQHKVYDELCEDLIAVLSLGAPMDELTPIVVRLIGFHIIRYQQLCAREYANDARQSSFVLEVVAPKKTLVRELAIESYQANNVVSALAVREYLNHIENSNEWKIAAADEEDAFKECLDLLKTKILWPRKDEDYDHARDPRSLMDAAKEYVTRRHGQHVGNVHRTYGKEIGLVSKRGTNRLRYAPTDSFLRMLTLVTVTSKLEFSQLLKTWYDRYGIVIGDTEAVMEFNVSEQDIDRKAFQGNAERLEKRMASIGLLRRLSDGCAYVINPYGRNKL